MFTLIRYSRHTFKRPCNLASSLNFREIRGSHFLRTRLDFSTIRLEFSLPLEEWKKSCVLQTFIIYNYFLTVVEDFYTFVFRRDVLWYGDVRPPGLHPSVHPSVRQSQFSAFSPTCFGILSWNFAYDLGLLFYRSIWSVVNFINLCRTYAPFGRQNRSTEGCSKLKRSVDMTSSGKNGLNIRTNASPKWDRTRCPEE